MPPSPTCQKLRTIVVLWQLQNSLYYFTDVEIFKNTFPEEQLFVKESKESFEIFYFQHEISKFKKIIQKTCIEAAPVFLQ